MKPAAARYGREHGISVIDGGCPCMFEPTSDPRHKAMRFICSLTGGVPRQGLTDRHGDTARPVSKETAMQLTHALDRWMYQSGHPNRVARALNRVWAATASAGLGPSRLVTLEVPGRRTGRTISFPVVVADLDGERYLVAMLGVDANWVRNVRAAGGRVVLRHGRPEAVRLEEVEPAARPPVLRRYLALAPGARAHVPVDRDTPDEVVAAIAPRYPVFRIVPDGEAAGTTTS